MKGVFDIADYHVQTGCPLDIFDVMAEFEDDYTRYTMLGMALGCDTSTVKRLIEVNPGLVNAACCRRRYRDDKCLVPLEFVLRIARTNRAYDWAVHGTLLLIHGASWSLIRSSAKLCDVVLCECLDNAKEFRAKLCAIFWVTQSIVVWRDMGEPLVERVFMSSLSD